MPQDGLFLETFGKNNTVVDTTLSIFRPVLEK